MFKVKYLIVEVTKGKMSKIPARVPQWEAQVLIALWGEEAQILGESFEMRELPEVNDEFTRLANKYGPRDEDVPMVARVYGSFGPGLKALENEFAASTMSIETETIVEDEPVVVAAGNGIAPVPGVTLPGSDKTFGPDAVPEVKDDVPALAGNTVTVGDEQKPIEEMLSATRAQTDAEKVDITDLTGETDGDDPVE